MNLRPSRATVFIGLGLVALLAIVALAAPRVVAAPHSHCGRGRAGGGARRARARRRERGRAERTINVKLFFQAADRPGLVIEERTVPFSSDLGAPAPGRGGAS